MGPPLIFIRQRSASLLVPLVMVGGIILGSATSTPSSAQVDLPAGAAIVPPAGQAVAEEAGRRHAHFTIETSPSSLHLGDTLFVTATLRTADGSPLPNRRILFAYNAEWARRGVVYTDSAGQAFWQLPIVNPADLKSSGFVQGGGTQNRGTDYSVHAIFFGDEAYVREELIGFFKVAQVAIPRTRVRFVTIASALTEQDSLTVIGELTSAGQPLASEMLWLRAFGRETSCSTGTAGRCALTISPKGRPAGNYVVTLDYPGNGGPAYGGATINRTVWLESSAAQPTRLPALTYWGWDFTNEDPAQHNYGPFGGTWAFYWNELVSGSFNQLMVNEVLLNDYLERARRMTITMPDGTLRPKPIILGMMLTDGYTDRAPQAVRRELPHYELQPTSSIAGESCPPKEMPRYDDPLYQSWYAASARAVGNYYRRHPEYHDVLVGWRILGGYDGEWAVMFKNDSAYPNCDYLAVAHEYVTEGEWLAFKRLALAVWANEFGGTPVELILETYHDADARAYGHPIGSKFNAADIEVASHAYMSMYSVMGQRAVSYWWRDQSTAYESRYEPFFMSGVADPQNPALWAGTYWMILWMLESQADWIDFHGGHWQAYASIPGFSQFVNEHLGKSCETTPSAWVVLREVADDNTKEANDFWSSGTYGDYQFCLYRPLVSGAQASPVRGIDLPVPAQGQYFTNPYKAKHGANSQIIALPGYSGRKTDQGWMYFDIDDSYVLAGQHSQEPSNQWRITIVYLDAGTDTWSLRYADAHGAEHRLDVTKTNSGEWREQTWTIWDLVANNQWPGSTDFALSDNSDGTEIFHRLQVRSGRPRAWHAYSIRKTPTIDGDLADWGGFASLRLDSAEATTVVQSSLTLNKAQAELRATWDERALYFAVHIVDSQVVSDALDFENNDWIELDLDGLHDHAAFNADDRRISLSAGGKRRNDGTAPGDVTTAVAAVPDGWTAEIVVPWTALGGSPTAERRLGFTWLLHDTDGVTGDLHLVWEGDETPSSSLTWGHLDLKQCTVPGDFDGDGVINGGDFQLLAQQWRQPSGATTLEATADLNGDGVISVLDLLTLDRSPVRSCDG
ncbi:MAG TPA: hypothetical protein DEP84_05170 [Chloroflexi bacterium]|nr:hypothetical protein [Chloroflexota bacterium]